MNKLFKKVAAFLASSACMLTFVGLSSHQDVKVANAATTNTYSYTFGEKSFTKDGQTKTLNGINWTIDTVSSSAFIQAEGGKGLHVGSSNNPSKGLNLTTLDFSEFNITNVSVDSNGSYTAFKTFIGTEELVNQDGGYKNPNNAVGALKLQWTGGTKAIYVKSISVAYEIPVTKYNVTFTGEGVTTPAQSIEEGKLATKPTDPVREGFAFEGWEDTPGHFFDFATPITGNVTLTAKWVDKTIPSITLNKDVTTMYGNNENTIEATLLNVADGSLVDWTVVSTNDTTTVEKAQTTVTGGKTSNTINITNDDIFEVTAKVNGQEIQDALEVTAYKNTIQTADLQTSNCLGLTYDLVDSKVKAFTKVTANKTDWTGKYLIVNEEAGKALDSSATASNIDKTDAIKDVVIKNSTIEYNENLEKNVFTVAKNGSNYSIKSSAGYYIGHTGTGKEITTDEKNPLNNDISIDSKGNAIIKNSSYELQYNSSSNQFKFYSSSQAPIQLYEIGEVAAQVPSFTEVRARLMVSIPTDIFNDKTNVIENLGIKISNTQNGVTSKTITKTVVNDGVNPQIQTSEDGTRTFVIFSIKGLDTTHADVQFNAIPFITIGGTSYEFSEVTFSIRTIVEDYSKMTDEQLGGNLALVKQLLESLPAPEVKA